MKGKLLLFLTLALLVPLAVSAQTGYTPPHQKPGPAAERLRFQAVHVDIAPASLRKGDLDFYLYSLKKEAAAALKGAAGVRVYEAPASTLSLILNPAPAPQGELNPLSLREVRFALQLLVNRAFIAQEVFRGLAQPMVTYVSPSDYDYLTVAELLREYDISYDPERGREMIGAAMRAAGATLKEGRWHYREKPIQLRFLIRVEDERREVGDLIRAEMEKAGFSVIPVYQSFAPAILTVYGTDPQLLQWHLYTEGWGRGGAERFDYATANQMAAPWMGNMPGWKETGFWQYDSPQLDELGQRLFRGDFATAQERNDLYRQIARQSLEESVRIWLVTVVNTFPGREEVQGVTEDAVAGPKSLFSLREAHIPGRDTLNVGSLWVWTERTTWNPIGGFGDVYSSDLWRNIHDPPLATHPFSGTPIPFRATFQVETAGPGGKLVMPPGAFLWDAKAGEFRPVAPGSQAISKVTFDYSRYFSSRWHHGEPITLADLVYALYQTFDLTYNEDKARVEPALATTSRPYLDTFKGFRLVEGDRLEVFVDQWHFDPNYIAAYASPAGLGMPWEVLAAMDRLVFEERRAAYTDTAAQRFGVPWLSLVMPRDSLLLRRALMGFEERGFVPRPLSRLGDRPLVSREEAVARYRAAVQWIDKYQMAVISSGPFKLVRFDPAAQFAELEAFRDPTYPFRPGDWYYGSIPRVAVAEVKASPVKPGAGAEVKVRLDGRPPLSLRYSLYDPAARRNLFSGEAERETATQFRVTLSAPQTADLKPGVYSLFLLAFSEELASPTETRVNLEVLSPGRAPRPVPVAPAGPGGGGLLWVAIGVVVAAGAVLAVWLLRRRSRKAR